MCACNYACMPVCEHIHVSLAQHMSRPTTKCSRVLCPIGLASVAPWWRKPPAHAECKFSPKLTPTNASPSWCLSPDHMPPSLKALVSLEASPSMQVARPAPLPPEWQWPGKRWLLAVCAVTQEGSGMESAEVYGKATVPGLTYQPGPRSPTRRRGFPATGEGGRAEGRGQERGETDKNHLSLTQWATSRSRGEE